MNVTKSKMTGMNCVVTIQDEELTIDFSVELGKEPIVTVIQDPINDLNYLDMISEEDLLLMQDMALNEVRELMANG